MVLEKLYNPFFIREKKYLAFLLGMAYSVFGISFAFFLFPEDPAIFAIAFITLISLVSLKGVVIHQEKVYLKPGSIKEFFNENVDLILVLFYLFLGVIVTFAFFTIFTSSMSANIIFQNQAEFAYSTDVTEIFMFGDFNSILINNLIVMFVCLVSSFLFGLGTVFLFIIIWNASVIGVVFGMAANNSTHISEIHPFLFFMLLLIAALPHIIFEIFGFFLGGMSGDKLSGLLISEHRIHKIERFKLSIIILIISISLILLGALYETFITPKLINFIF